MDFDEFYMWWTQHLELSAGPVTLAEDNSVLDILYASKKRSFLGGDADVALMMAVANGHKGCEQLLINAGAKLDDWMKQCAVEQLSVIKSQQIAAEVRQGGSSKSTTSWRPLAKPASERVQQTTCSKESNICEIQ